MKIGRYFVMMFLVAGVFVASAYAGTSDHNQFWMRFRDAVIGNDVSTIITMTHFPFEVHGTTDDYPIQHYDNKMFRRNYKKLLDQKQLLPSGKKFVTKTMFEMIKEKTTIGSKELLAQHYIRVEDFEFQKIHGCWFFTAAYLDE